MQVTPHELCLASRAKRVYANAHTYHINSISVNSDQATFLSADDLRINLWDLEVTNRSFNIVDIKPANMEDLTEVKGLLLQGCAPRTAVLHTVYWGYFEHYS
jgi:serine/threonine-protein phosphatase 2A regulatory subunit B